MKRNKKIYLCVFPRHPLPLRPPRPPPILFRKFDNILLTIHNKMFRVGARLGRETGNTHIHVFFVGLRLLQCYCYFLLNARDSQWSAKVLLKSITVTKITEADERGSGRGGGVWNSLISKNLAHYSLSLKSLKFLLIL